MANGVPFVMGTTGGDREALLRDVHEAGASAVIAPQMGKQVHQTEFLGFRVDCEAMLTHASWQADDEGNVPHKALSPGTSCANGKAGQSHSSYPSLLGREY